MGKLDAALAWAQRGLRVFPLQQNGKLPASDLGWTLAATTDPAVIRMWWLDPVTGYERDLNIGFLTTDWIVVDVDVKKGKRGLDTFFDLGMEFDTLCMRTPTGGYHLVYRDFGQPVGCAPLGQDVDIKAFNGFVVAPGSTIDGGEYVLEIDQPVVAFPEHLRHRLKPPRKQAEALAVDVELDAPESVELAAHWLQHDAPVAVEGMNGDDTTYRVCCRLHDLGVSETTALDLFLDEYNPRCEPPWPPSEARAKIENAYRYAKGAAGAASPAAAFEGVVPVPLPSRDNMDAPLDPSVFKFGAMMSEDDIRPRPWILYGFLMEQNLTTLVAPPGAGKSLISLMLAAHLAVGRDFMGYEIRRPGKSIVYNAEDSFEEMSRRMLMICDAYGFDRDEVNKKVCLMTSEKMELEITRGSPPSVYETHVQQLIDAASDPEIVFVSIDPLIEVHTGRENDVTEMRYVMGVLRRVARQARVAGLAVQHTPKENGRTDVAGSMDASRGSTAIPAAARYMLTMRPAKDEECVTKLGVPVSERGRFVRLDGAKAQAVAAVDRDRTCWMQWETRTLTNGDGVGVLLPYDATGAQEAEARRAAGILAERMFRDGTAALPLEDAVTTICEAADPMQPPESRDVVKTRLTRLLALPVQTERARVALVTETVGGKKVTRVVLR